MQKATAFIAALCLAGSALAVDKRQLAADIDPCSDFYAYVNQPWLQATELPPDRARIGSFDSLRLANDRLLERALGELVAAPEPPTSPGLRLVAADFAAGMDLAGIEARGLKSLAPWLDRIDALRAPEQLPRLLGALARADVEAPFDLWIAPDAKDRRRHVLSLAQGGLGLPDRDDYFTDDERAQRLRAAYRTYARRLLEGAGAAPTEAVLDALLAFERRLAEASSTVVERRDPMRNYNPFTVDTLAEAAPGLDWRAWLGALAGRTDVRLVVGQPGFMQAVARLAADTPLDTWRTYLRVRLLDATARRLPRAFAQAAFEYRDVAIRGLRQPPPRGEQVLQSISRGPVSEGLGELYVAKAFSPKAQERALQLVADIRTAMQRRIERLDWMSAETKARAQAKLAAMVTKIGKPPTWRRYAGLVFERDDYAGNQLRAAEWQTADRLADLDRPVDRERWFTSPHIVNAFAGSLNDIVFPAGILQPPFFDAEADDAVNYGAIGMVIGHEITHHFDDRGRQYDAFGNLADWWAPADAAAYKERADRVAALYSSYEAAPGVRLNGRQTLGENISDVSGVQIAYDGLQIALQRSGKATEKGGLTPSQRFFVANAIIWRSKERMEALITQVRTGQHSPGPFRVRGPLSNLPAFAQAFQCKPGSPMAAADPITVW